VRIRRRLLGRLVEAFIVGVSTAGIARLDAMEIGLPARLLAGLAAFSPIRLIEASRSADFYISAER
jgi:hypothetical protein